LKKHDVEITVTEDGMKIARRPLSENARSPMELRCEIESNETVVRFVQWKKLEVQMDSTVPGIAMDSRALDANADGSIRWRIESAEKEIEMSDSHFSKHDSGRMATEEGKSK
jgi:hypothetical protein